MSEPDERPQERNVPLRTGAETPVDPEDLAMAEGLDPTPENIERMRRRLQERGSRAVDEATP